MDVDGARSAPINWAYGPVYRGALRPFIKAYGPM